MIRTLLVLASLVIGQVYVPSALAAEWIKVAQSGPVIYYIDASSIRIVNGLVLFWSHSETSQPEVEVNSGNYFVSVTVESIANCRANSMQSKQFIYYSADGRVVNKISGQTTFEENPPGSVGETTLKFACEWAFKQQSNNQVVQSPPPNQQSDAAGITDEQWKAHIDSISNSATERASSYRYQPWYAFFVGGFAILYIFIGIAWCEHYFKSPTSANEQGKKWAAWIAVISAAHPLIKYLWDVKNPFNEAYLIQLLAGLVMFIPIAYGTGFAYFKYRNRKNSSDSTQAAVNDNPAVLAKNTENAVAQQSRPSQKSVSDASFLAQAEDEIKNNMLNQQTWFDAVVSAESGNIEAAKECYKQMRVAQLKQNALK